MPTFPFVKPKPVLALPAPRVTIGELLGPRGLPNPVFELDIKIPWERQPRPVCAAFKKSTVQLVMQEYAVAFPSKRLPSNTDLIEWLYQRAQDGEREAAHAKKAIKDLETELRIMDSRGI